MTNPYWFIFCVRTGQIVFIYTRKQKQQALKKLNKSNTVCGGTHIIIDIWEISGMIEHAYWNDPKDYIKESDENVLAMEE